ncbi:OsmC family protein [Nitrincola alkalilacustris]|uniref:OsmC family protein n=1 Tax=Nitrincola alkalilacustris TaxID=1571224 RepID=UPI00197CDC38|nr:OsmC family protein [Nitrincola alkalilacustris]
MNTMNTQTPTIRNGVNVTALFDTIEAVKGNQAIAQFKFRAGNRWMGGDHNHTTVKGFYGACEEMQHAQTFEMDNGEPAVLLGADEYPNPVEFVLHALIGCLTTTMVYHAAARGITIDGIESELEGDLDLRGFLGLSDEVRKGFHNVRVTMRVKSTASAAALRELAKYSPVYDIVSNSLPVEVRVETC